MPRACLSGLSLLLMVGLTFAVTNSSLEIINPWLSASDLQSASAAAHLQPGCSGHETLCPPPCPNANSTKSTQCLYYLKESHKEEVCGRNLGPERRREVLHGLRMSHCCEHVVDAALPEAAFQGGNTCRGYLQDLLEVDELARRVSCGHADLLTRYDCGQNYSIVHHCTNCKESYRRWVCSSLVPHFSRSGERILPCLSVCEDVEQQCPYLLPDQTLTPSEAAHPTPQYAGEPNFLCLDPNIPQVGEQRAKSLMGDEDCCYTHCGTPGRGSSTTSLATTTPSPFTSPPWGTSTVLNVCEHCPGRPLNNTGTPDATNVALQGSHVSSSTSGSSSVRTINKVSLLWTTTWILLLLQVHSRQTILNILLIINSLIMCAISVRTVMMDKCC